MLAIDDINKALQEGSLTARSLLEECFDRMDAPGSQAETCFTRVYRQSALEEANTVDVQRKAGAHLPPYAGIPITVKDLFDLANEVTTAGSKVLAESSPAVRDATAVARLKRAGFIVVGRTNMTEFAYSGLGINPHYGTPLNPWDRAGGRIPGGSSSGAAIAVTDHFAAASLGTDTGGSCRIPAALTGVVGFKPTASRVPMTGVLPLSTTLDSVGPLGKTVSCCVAMDSILSSDSMNFDSIPSIQGLRLAVPQRLVLEDMDNVVSGTFDRTLDDLSRLGAVIVDIDLPALDEIASINRLGGFTAAEAYACHRDLLEERGAEYDPRVRVRILRGEQQTAADYIQILNERKNLIAGIVSEVSGFDAIVCPTVPVVAPKISDLEDDDAYHRYNLLMLRNPSVANMIDGCSISIPVHRPGEAPVGLMLTGTHGADRHLLGLALAIERGLGQEPGPGLG